MGWLAVKQRHNREKDYLDPAKDCDLSKLVRNFKHLGDMIILMTTAETADIVVHDGSCALHAATLQPKSQWQTTSDLYLAPLDGLRFLAFLLVFVHHLPAFAPSPWLVELNRYGWVGVELFFVLSSFLFFHLLSAEYTKTGTISARNFYIRRLLRVYPLMVALPALMLIIFGSPDGLGPVRLAALALFVDNFVTWLNGYNLSIPFSAHLWTLSFEFQVYLLIPFAFLALRRLGSRRFMITALVVLAYCFLARMTFFAAGAKHPVIWVTPFLRPESVITGMILFALRPQWHWGFSAGSALITALLFLNIPEPWTGATASALSYPIAALMCGSAIDAVLRAPWASAALSLKALRGLGRISYGLYVYHVLAIWLAQKTLGDWLARPLDASVHVIDYLMLFSAALASTIMFSVISYYGFERWLERLKSRFAAVEGRPSAQRAASRSEAGAPVRGLA